jgi:hypothetical protein
MKGSSNLLAHILELKILSNDLNIILLDPEILFELRKEFIRLENEVEKVYYLIFSTPQIGTYSIISFQVFITNQY